MWVDFGLVKDSWLRVHHDDEDLLVQELIDQATGMILDFIKRPDPGWTATTLPRHVRAALFHILKRLYEREEDPMPGYVKDMLWRERDPALA